MISLAVECSKPAVFVPRARCSLSPRLRPLAHRYLRHFSRLTRPRHRDVVHFLFQDEGLHRASNRHSLSIKQWFTRPQQIEPVATAASWNLPVIESISELAHWLLLTPEVVRRSQGLRAHRRRRPAKTLQLPHPHKALRKP